MMKLKIVLLVFIGSYIGASEQLSNQLTSLQRVAFLFYEVRQDILEIMHHCITEHGEIAELQAREQLISNQCADISSYAQRLPQKYLDLVSLKAISGEPEATALQSEVNKFDDLWRAPFSEKEITVMSAFPVILALGNQAAPEQASILFFSLQQKYQSEFRTLESLQIPEAQIIARAMRMASEERKN